MVELVAVGRTAEVFVYGDGRVVKLDRPEWNGLSHYEAGVVRVPSRPVFQYRKSSRP